MYKYIHKIASYTHTYTHTHTHIHTCMYIIMSMFTDMYVRVCVHARVHTCLHAWMQWWVSIAIHTSATYTSSIWIMNVPIWSSVLHCTTLSSIIGCYTSLTSTVSISMTACIWVKEGIILIANQPYNYVHHPTGLLTSNKLYTKYNITIHIISYLYRYNVLLP